MKMHSSQENSRGFTLIELLVVIAIIGLLASVVFASLGPARLKARDARRKTDLQQISRALELYYAQYGGFPSSACPAEDYRIKVSLAQEPKMAAFLSPFPEDPVPPGANYNDQYLYLSDIYNRCDLNNNAPATKYTLYATLEDQSTTNLTNTNTYDAWLMAGSQQTGSARPNFKICSSNGCRN